jgi:uncharacterized alpha-E superfamily protein
MNRYLERAENYARFMDVNYNLSLEYLKWSRPMETTCTNNRRLELYESLNDKVENKVIYFLALTKTKLYL